jgi:hypothetical protein
MTRHWHVTWKCFAATRVPIRRATSCAELRAACPSGQRSRCARR